MIAKQQLNRSFARAVEYVMRADHDPRIVGGTMPGRDERELIEEFRGLRRRRPDVERPVYHLKLSAAREDRRLEPHELADMADRVMARLGLERAAYVVVEHRDRLHQHVHVVASRVRDDGTLVRWELGEWAKTHEVLRQLEREYGLRQVPVERAGGERAPHAIMEYRMAREDAKVSATSALQVIVGEAWRGQPTLTDFIARLDAAGVEFRVVLRADGTIAGVSYGRGKYAFRGRSLGPSYTWEGLQREGVRFDPVRDRGVAQARGRLAPERTPARAAERQERLKLILRELAASRPTLSELVGRLDALGIKIELNVARTGHVSGVTYQFEGHAHKGSELGREFSWQGLLRQGVNYDRERDRETALAVARGRVPERPEGPGVTAEERDRLQRAVGDALRDRPTLGVFVDRLERQGIGLHLYVDEKERVLRHEYRLGGKDIAGGEVGHTWRSLQESGLRYTEADRRPGGERGRGPAGETRDRPKKQQGVPERGVVDVALEARYRLAQVKRLALNPAGELARMAGRVIVEKVFEKPRDSMVARELPGGRQAQNHGREDRREPRRRRDGAEAGVPRAGGPAHRGPAQEDRDRSGEGAASGRQHERAEGLGRGPDGGPRDRAGERAGRESERAAAAGDRGGRGDRHAEAGRAPGGAGGYVETGDRVAQPEAGRARGGDGGVPPRHGERSRAADRGHEAPGRSPARGPEDRVGGGGARVRDAADDRGRRGADVHARAGAPDAERERPRDLGRAAGARSSTAREAAWQRADAPLTAFARRIESVLAASPLRGDPVIEKSLARVRALAQPPQKQVAELVKKIALAPAKIIDRSR